LIANTLTIRGIGNLLIVNILKFLDGSLLSCSAVWSGRSLPTFQRSLLPPSSGADYTALQPARQPSLYSPP
jgi:hypothetical protein